MMRIVFMGTPAFAAEALRALCEDGGHDVALVVTNPDKPSGRGHKLTPAARQGLRPFARH